MSLCNCNQGRLLCTCKTVTFQGDGAHGVSGSPENTAYFANESRLTLPAGCEIVTGHYATGDSGGDVLTLPPGCEIVPGHSLNPRVDPAVVTSLSSAPVRKLAERIAVAVAGDEQLGGGCDLSAGMFGTRLSALVVELAGQEAELYAAQDQVTGLQELMAAPRVPAGLDAAVRYLVAQADDKARTHHYATGGSPRHGHSAPGRWDGDRTHVRGSLCEECAAWNVLRKYASTDIVAMEQNDEQ